MSNSRIYRDGRFKCFLAKDLDEAYSLKFFSGSMTRWELMDRITKYNPNLRWFANRTHRALWDIDKKDGGFICGIDHRMTIPRYSIMEYNFDLDKKINYCDMNGEATGSEIVNMKELEYKALARGWEAILSIVKRKGYKIDERGI